MEWYTKDTVFCGAGMCADLYQFFFRFLMEQMGMAEQLKSENALEWVQRMNNILACAKEIVEKEIIFA